MRSGSLVGLIKAAIDNPPSNMIGKNAQDQVHMTTSMTFAPPVNRFGELDSIISFSSSMNSRSSISSSVVHRAMRRARGA